jgi:membrane-bound inhibitor of C-type lysozyme
VNVQHVMHTVAGLCLCMAGALHAETIHARFDCDGGESIEAAFDNGPKPSVELPQALSASGARYANGDESIVFWNKGDTAVIEESGRTTYRDCVAKK